MTSKTKQNSPTDPIHTDKTEDNADPVNSKSLYTMRKGIITIGAPSLSEAVPTFIGDSPHIAAAVYAAMHTGGVIFEVCENQNRTIYATTGDSPMLIRPGPATEAVRIKAGVVGRPMARMIDSNREIWRLWSRLA